MIDYLVGKRIERPMFEISMSIEISRSQLFEDIVINGIFHENQ